ncbi:sugar transporter [Thalassotalea loyana]|uniref:Sugar transporter n=2 Tax=Thalassotalea loyana TaxID=280483 RepID=A0ABQ6HIL7_9GAMM|nr:sugar transporter [Thalassotalea loyana]
MRTLAKKAIVVTLALTSMGGFAAQINQAQIEQFRKLPKAQQEALAKQYGVDLSSITSAQNSTTEVVEDTPVQPRQIENQQSNYDDDELKLSEDGIEVEAALKPFGYDVFANEPMTFEPNMAISVPDNYIIGVGDEIKIQTFGKESNSYDLVVNREGKIIIPELGPYQVSGLSYSDLTAFLKAKIAERVIGVEAVVSLSKLRSIRVFVAGEAYKPGPYTLNALSSMTHALFAAGGINTTGSLRNIQLKRAGQIVGEFDIYDLLINGDSSNDLLLRSGDVLFIPAKGAEVAIEGAVRRPAIYELKNNENFNDIIKISGGLLAQAYKDSVPVERYHKSLKTIISIDLNDNNDSLLKVKNGDHIQVMKNSDMFSQSVMLIGAVARPGKYQWKPGHKITDLIQSVEMSLLPHADLNYSLIVREVDLAKRIEVLQFSIADALTNTVSEQNLELHSRDKVIIFSNVDKLASEVLTLDKFAFSQESLLAKEKLLAKHKYNDKNFWAKYGDGDFVAPENSANAGVTEVLNSSINDIAQIKDKKEIDVRKLGMFSRQRLLVPIINRLRSQSSGGEVLKLVEVDGQVKFPGIYPLPVKGNVKSLIVAAGGVTESAYLDRADITRSMLDNAKATKRSFSIDLSSAFDDADNSMYKLNSKDRIYVHQIPEWSENHIIELKGEFVFPGKYTIERGETLSDIIQKAGGLTEYAFAEGSVFTRKKLKELERENVERLADDLRVEMASKSLTEDGLGVSYAEAQSLLADLTNLDPLGRLVIELPRVLTEDNYDVTVENGDVLYVPTKKDSINVIGQVQVTTSHMYDPSLEAVEYIERSGGMKKRADEDRIYIVKANGTVELVGQESWFSNRAEDQMQPGDTIVVPLDSGYMTNLTLWSTATQIIYNTAVAIAAISGI